MWRDRLDGRVFKVTVGINTRCLILENQSDCLSKGTHNQRDVNVNQTEYYIMSSAYLYDSITNRRLQACLIELQLPHRLLTLSISIKL